MEPSPTTTTTTTSTTNTQDYTPEDWLKLALQEAQKCIPSKQAYNVGSLIITQSSNQLLTQGYSRELNGNLHAEQVALLKLSNSIQSIPIEPLKIFVSMEPCSIRLSNQISCTDSILHWNQTHPFHQIKEIYIGTLEPKDLVICKGQETLISNGIQVKLIKGFEDECLRIARMK